MMSTATDSMLQAVATVALRHGVDSDVPTLKRSYALADPVLDTNMVLAMVKELGLEGRCLDVSWSQLQKLGSVLPAILRRRDGGALILEGVLTETAAGQVAMVRDPEQPPEAQALLDQSHLAEVWTGEIFLIKRRYRLDDDHRPFGFSWLLAQAMRERHLFRDIAISSIMSTIFVLTPPLMVILILDRVLANQSYSTLAVIAGAIGLLILFEMVLSFLRRRFTEITATRIDGRLHVYIMEKLLRLPMDYFERTPTGVTLGKIGKIWQIRQFITGQLLSTFLDAVTLIGLVPVLLIIDWRLALFVFTLTGIIFVIVYMFLKPLGRLQARITATEQRKGSFLVETIHGMKTVKSLALEGQRRHRWDKLVAQAMVARHEWGDMANWPQTFVLPFERLIYSGTFLLGATVALYYPDQITAGTLMAFTMLAGRTAAPLVNMARLLESWGNINEAVGEVASIMNHPSEGGKLGSGLRMPIRGEIAFQDVSFRYSRAAPLALDRVSFPIRKGTIFGIMGRSGSGKTTITRLLQGLNPDYEGIIKVDGMDLREIELHHLRTSIGVVPQENFLFSGTVRENIGIARPDATFPEIVRAAQLAGAEEFIERLPRGYDTPLEEGATNLSGGQRQRLAIARALILNPPILVLDEATSALDAESEAIINANLVRIAEERTIICVSHRLSMLVPADAILVMERGEVYDIGRHEELLLRCDIYKQMWYQQNSHVERRSPHVPLAISHS